MKNNNLFKFLTLILIAISVGFVSNISNAQILVSPDIDNGQNYEDKKLTKQIDSVIQGEDPVDISNTPILVSPNLNNGQNYEDKKQTIQLNQADNPPAEIAIQIENPAKFANKIVESTIKAELVNTNSTTRSIASPATALPLKERVVHMSQSERDVLYGQISDKLSQATPGSEAALRYIKALEYLDSLN